MKVKDLWFVAVVTAVMLTMLVSVLGIWGIISGVTALKLFYTLGMLGLGLAFLKSLLGGPLNPWRAS